MLSDLSCESCILEKQSRSSFPSSVAQHVSFLFALVHSNIWRSSCVKYNFGFQYFVTFIDDFLRRTWLFLMKNRSELFFIFKSFFNKIKSQFAVSIRILHSDNAHEYLSHSLNTFIKSHGIIHQTSCAHAPQQNGVAKRKNRHFVETTYTILIHSGVPQRFWGDVVLSVCYLINSMTFSILKNKIPHSILFPCEPLHPLPLKVFGSSCFVHNFCPEILINYLLGHTNVSLWDSLDLKKDINISHPLLTTTSFLQMSHLLSLLFCFKSLSSPLVSPSNQVHISIVFDTPEVSSVPKDSSHPPPL